MLQTTGVHGVEAYTGSAVQLALLESPPAPPEGCALVLVHVLNPFGMSWLRRTNENNVDLNRNFLPEEGPWTGAPDLYRTLDPLLNPPSPPSGDAFLLRAALFAMRHGFHRVKQAVAKGQYEFPRGLFFGGDGLQEGPRLYTRWLAENLRAAEYVFVLDLHTGLGTRGTDTVARDAHLCASPAAALSQALRRTFIDVEGRSVAYTVRGGIASVYARALPGTHTDFVLQEIGTEPPLAVLHALREENRWHFFGGGSIVHPAKARLREALCPSSAEWRRRALDLGVDLARAAARWTFGRGK